MPAYKNDKVFNLECRGCDTRYTVVMLAGASGVPSKYCPEHRGLNQGQRAIICRRKEERLKGNKDVQTAYSDNHEASIKVDPDINYSSNKIKKHITLVCPKASTRIVQVCDHFLRAAEAEIHIYFNGELFKRIRVSVNAQGWTMHASEE